MNVWIDGMTVKVMTKAPDIGLSQLKEVGGGRFNGKTKCWSFPLEKYDVLVTLRNRLNGHVALKPVHINSSALVEMETYLKDRGYSERSIKSYHRHLGYFLKYSGGRNDEESIERYVSYIREEKKASDAYCRSAIKSIGLHKKLESTK